jgi:UDP-N-acetylglucosamine transferase subunit ALG13
VIFATVGTNETPFERLVSAVADIPGEEELIIQTGHCTTRPARARCVDFLSFEEMLDHVRRSRVVVCHAGVGSIMMSLMAGRRPIVLARRVALGEAVDDHQVALARRLGDAGLVVVANGPVDLPAAVADDGVLEPFDANVPTDLARDLREYLESSVRHPRVRHRRGFRRSLQ